MSEQKSYEISYEYQPAKWRWDCWVPGDTWQDAIHNWLERRHKGWEVPLYQVISETPSEDGLSGIMEITEDKKPESFLVVRNINATIISP